MNLHFNAADILDLVLDGVLYHDQLRAIADQLYIDRRGGELVHLWANTEFLDSLQEQLYPSKKESK